MFDQRPLVPHVEIPSQEEDLDATRQDIREKMMFFQGALAARPDLTSAELKELYENQRSDIG